VSARLSVVLADVIQLFPERPTEHEPKPKVLTESQLNVLGLLIRDAISYRTPLACDDCVEGDGLCDDCFLDLARTDDYMRLAAELGIDLEADEAGLGES
jgi:hypothetical protein